MNANVNDFTIADCVCKKEYYVDRLNSLIPKDAAGREYDWLRAHDFEFETWNCVECPESAVCNGTTDGKGNVGQARLLPIGCSATCNDDGAISAADGLDGQQGSRPCCSSKVSIAIAECE